MQCAIPVFNGLFLDEHQTSILKLLFLCAHWHGLAKLRMHSDLTLEILDKLTTQMGDAFRFFSAHVCIAYKTHELPREENARRRREAKNNKQFGDPMVKDSKKKETGPKLKEYNANTYKHHSLGDYVAHIREKGTTDSYSTEPVSPIAPS